MKRHYEPNTGQTDEWYTPAYIFEALGERFDLDVAAPADGPRYVPCSRWCSTLSLMREWDGFVWMNPPFGARNGLEPWLEKFFAHGNGIALTPDRSSAPWWQMAANRSDAFLMLDHRVKFERPDGSVGKTPSNGTTLWAAGSRGVSALIHGAHRLGFLVIREQVAA